MTSDNFTSAKRKEYIKKRLVELGMSKWGLLKTETKALYDTVHSSEELGGVVFGHSNEGSVMLVASDRRLIYIDTKPLFKKIEDISYDVLAGITTEWVGPRGTVVVHTRLGDFHITTVNHKAAKIFKEYVEKRCIEHQREDSSHATTI